MAQFGFVKEIQDQRHICQWKDVKLIKKRAGIIQAVPKSGLGNLTWVEYVKLP